MLVEPNHICSASGSIKKNVLFLVRCFSSEPWQKNSFYHHEPEHPDTIFRLYIVCESCDTVQYSTGVHHIFNYNFNNKSKKIGLVQISTRHRTRVLKCNTRHPLNSTHFYTNMKWWFTAVLIDFGLALFHFNSQMDFPVK